jgi:transcriptional regulator with XRE-family HTH domain
MVGEYIRSLRASAGLTQRQLATDVGISPSLLSHVEAGRREPTIRLLRDISRVLGIPTAALFAVALDESSTDDPTPTIQKLRAMNAELLAAVQHSIVLRRLQAARDRK